MRCHPLLSRAGIQHSDLALYVQVCAVGFATKPKANANESGLGVRTGKPRCEQNSVLQAAAVRRVDYRLLQ
jgi:hypothetical protein